MKPKFKEIDLTNHNNKKDSDPYYRGNMPYVHVFLHSPKGSFVIKGYVHTVGNYIKEHFPINIHNTKYFGPKRGNKSQNWYFDGTRCRIRCPGHKNYATGKRERKFKFWVHTRDASGFTTETVLLKLKRIPNKWIPEYDEIIKAINGE